MSLSKIGYGIVMNKEIANRLEEAYEMYAKPTFVDDDPISIPKRYTKKQDIEITAFWTSMLAWGLRKTIINKATQLFELMGDSPYDFFMNHRDEDLARFEDFKHRTFNYTDTLFFIDALKRVYQSYDSLEDAFILEGSLSGESLNTFYDFFFSPSYAPQRTRKHLAAPRKKSTCKRICMFLRWIVRSDKEGIDLGLWKKIKPSQLYLPLDVHVDRSARALGLITRKQRDWKTVVEITDAVRELDPEDPCRFDFALFGMSLNKEF